MIAYGFLKMFCDSILQLNKHNISFHVQGGVMPTILWATGLIDIFISAVTLMLLAVPVME